MLRSRAFSALALALVLLGLREVRADDEEPVRQALVLRMFNVGALTMGRSDFFGERSNETGPGSEENPLFGAEAEEPWYPVGGIDELIEQVKAGTRLTDWTDVEGTDIKALDTRYLVVRAQPQTIGRVAQFLTALEKDVLGTVTVELRAVPVPPQSIRPGVEALLEASDAGSSLTLTAFPGQRASAFRGRQHAYVSGHEGMVANSIAAFDPTVSVANLGLCANVRAYRGAGAGQIRVLVQGWLALPAPAPRTVELGNGRSIEADPSHVARVHADVVVRAGTWNLVAMTGAAETGQRWAFLVRVVANPHEGRPGPIAMPSFDASPAAKTGPFERRILDVGALVAPVALDRAPPVHLWPSYYVEPEAPELPEPRPAMPGEAIVDFVRASLPQVVTGEDEITIEYRRDRLWMQMPPNALDLVSARLAELKRELLWSIETRVDVVEASNALAAKLLRVDAPRVGSPLLDPEASALLEAALKSGEASRLDEAQVSLLNGQRNAALSGNWQTHVTDYELKIGDSAVAATPVRRQCLSGLTVDVEAGMASGGDSVALEVRVMRTRLPKVVRAIETAHGTLELPDLDVLRVRTSLQVPVGRTAIVGAGAEGGRTRLLLVTPTLRRPAD